MHSIVFASALFSAVPFVVGHGHVEKPPSRTPGDAFKASCGQQLLSQQSSDINGNLQGEMQIAAGQTDYDPSKCNLNMCKGFQYEDNTANVQSYSVGDVVDFTVQIAAPHTGVMNVSVIDLASNTVIGDPLISMTDYASNAHTIPANNTAFSVTMPDVASQCGQAGACALQWWWDATSINQVCAIARSLCLPPVEMADQCEDLRKLHRLYDGRFRKFSRQFKWDRFIFCGTSCIFCGGIVCSTGSICFSPGIICRRSCFVCSGLVSRRCLFGDDFGNIGILFTLFSSKCTRREYLTGHELQAKEEAELDGQGCLSQCSIALTRDARLIIEHDRIRTVYHNFLYILDWTVASWRSSQR